MGRVCAVAVCLCRRERMRGTVFERADWIRDVVRWEGRVGLWTGGQVSGVKRCVVGGCERLRRSGMLLEKSNGIVMPLEFEDGWNALKHVGT